MEINEKPVIKDYLTTEKPRYLKEINSDMIVEVTDINGATFSGNIVHGTLLDIKIGEYHGYFIRNMFEPCDYTPPQTVEEYEAQGMEKFAFEFVTQGEVTPETEQPTKNVHPVKGVNTDIHGNPISGNNLVWNDKQTLINALARIAELETQLAAKNETTVNTEQLPVYDVEWLNLIVGRYYPTYGVDNNALVFIDAGEIGNYYVDPKASAGIIMAALAKELNGNNPNADCYIYYDNMRECVDWKQTSNERDSLGLVLFVNAQKAIDILDDIEPQILKNYFQ